MFSHYVARPESSLVVAAGPASPTHIIAPDDSFISTTSACEFAANFAQFSTETAACCDAQEECITDNSQTVNPAIIKGLRNFDTSDTAIIDLRLAEQGARLVEAMVRGRVR